MRKQCPECKDGKLKPIGISGYNDLIEAECNKCHTIVEVESDGLGDGGLEFVDAYLAELDKEY